MKLATAAQPFVRNSAETARRDHKRSQFFRKLGIASFATGFVLPALGLFFIVLHGAAGVETRFDEFGGALMIASIPVLLFGSHLMDMSER